MSHAMSFTDLRLSNLEVHQSPFPFLIGKEILPESIKNDIYSDFPTYKEAGYFPYEAKDCGPATQALVETLSSKEFANQLGDHLGIEQLGQYPTLITIATMFNKRHGNIHTDSAKKIATALVYLNDDWNPAHGGCLRFLKNKDMNDTVVPEIPPLYGTLAMFKRADNSFHGHLPYEGKRRVIQIAWIVSEEALQRKSKRGKFSHLVKKLFSRQSH